MLAVACLSLGVSAVRAQVVDPNLWGVNGQIFALARSGNTLYVGGAFNLVGQCTGGAVALPKHVADPHKPFPKVAGYVITIAADGQGGWFLAGHFTAVGGVARYSLAHVLADGSVATWNPNPNTWAEGVYLFGGTLYVTGGFATISGKSRLYIAAYDAKSGELTDWDVHSDGIAIPMAIRGNTLFLVGAYTEIGGQPRNNIAAVDATTGLALPWNPDADAAVWSMNISDRHIYVGGSFTRIGGKNRSLLAELDPVTGQALDWDPNVQGPRQDYYNGPYVDALVMQSDRLYVGGKFTSAGSVGRNSLAAFDTRTGTLLPWNPKADARYGVPSISVMRSDRNSIYVGGYFRSVGGKPRSCVAELNAFTGAASDWNPDPDPNHDVFAIAITDDTVCIGGTFKSMEEVPRNHLAAFDLTTGRVKDWDPKASGLLIYAMAASGGRIYVGGSFDQIGGQTRADLAALDTLSGAATDWNPSPDQAIRAILVNGSTVYVGGGFQNIGGQPRRYLAALDAATGAARPWNPDPNNGVIAIALRGSTVYAGGFFDNVGGQYHSGLAAVDAATGAVLPWHVDGDGFVEALAISGNTVYAGGWFKHVNDVARAYLVAVDADTGTIKPWDPAPYGPREDYYDASVHTLLASGQTIFVGGDFTVIGGQRRAALAALDGVSGVPLDWAPDPDQSVWALASDGHAIFAGGYFQAVEGQPHAGLLAASRPGTKTPIIVLPWLRPHALALEPIAPNPVRSSALVRYALPSPGPVSLTVYDLQGRRMASVVDHEFQEVGEHQLSVPISNWPTGCYLYRLEAAGASATRKVVVLR